MLYLPGSVIKLIWLKFSMLFVHWNPATKMIRARIIIIKKNRRGDYLLPVVTNSCEEGTSKMRLCDCEYSSVCALLAVLVVPLSLRAVPWGVSLWKDQGRGAFPLAQMADGDALGAGNLWCSTSHDSLQPLLDWKHNFPMRSDVRTLPSDCIVVPLQYCHPCWPGSARHL